MKRMFFEMEMVTPAEVMDIEKDLRDRDCRYVVDHSEPIAFISGTLYESAALYGELPLEYEELGMDESAHGYGHLKEVYEQRYGTKETRIYTIEFRNDASSLTEHYSMTNPFQWLGSNMKHYQQGISGLTITPARDGNLYLPF